MQIPFILPKCCSFIIYMVWMYSISCLFEYIVLVLVANCFLPKAGQVGVLYKNLQKVMAGGTPEASYDGYSSCPLVTGECPLVTGECPLVTCEWSFLPNFFFFIGFFFWIFFYYLFFLDSFFGSETIIFAVVNVLIIIVGTYYYDLNLEILCTENIKFRLILIRAQNCSIYDYKCCK